MRPPGLASEEEFMTTIASAPAAIPAPRRARRYMDRKSLVPLLLFIPPALILFVTFVVLPMIVYHQMQFMACAALARRYAARDARRVLAVGAGKGA